MATWVRLAVPTTSLAPQGNAMVPMYPPGLPLVMAAAKIMGADCAPFWIAPLGGAILVVATFVIGCRLGSDWIGVLAVWILATSPVFLCMVFNAMSDVPAAAGWAVATVCALRGTAPSLVAGGIVAGVTLLIRPNLAPLALVLLVWALWNGRTRGASWRSTIAAFVPGVAAAGLALAAFNSALYGSPLASGYAGLVGFALSNVSTNLGNWLIWVPTTQTPLLFVGWASLYVFSGSLWNTFDATRTARLLGAEAATVVCAYVTYQPWEPWWFLRFRSRRGRRSVLAPPLSSSRSRSGFPDWCGR